MKSEYKNGWLEKLPDKVYIRLCECRNFKSDLPILVDTRWDWMKSKMEEGIIPNEFTKEDALVYILELLDANSQWYLADMTVAEYDALKKED